MEEKYWKWSVRRSANDECMCSRTDLNVGFKKKWLEKKEKWN